MVGEIELKKCCAECGFPIDIPRKPVFIKNNMVDFVRVESNKCSECGHQKDGWTIPVVYEKIQKLVSNQYNARKDLLKFFNEYIHMTEENKKEVAVNLQDEKGDCYPYSWNVMAIEVLADTELGRRMLREIEWSK